MAASSPSQATRLEYLQLQQECDFALWRVHEANAEAKKAFVLHLAGEGSAPSPHELDAIAQLERNADAKYRALCEFVRRHLT